MTSVTARVAAARRWLEEQHIIADSEWLTGCVEYLCSEGEGRTQQEINGLAREQWLLNDLKDVSGGCLPPGLHAHANTQLPGRYVLQVNCALDVGTPAYQQYQKLKKVNMENIEETTRHEDKIPNHRMIKLYLTDGVQEIFGMEYRTMRNLTCDITPGCKLLLKGPVVCRRGMLLLQEHNIEILGGEVEDLASENNLASLLSRLLGVQDVGSGERAQPPPAIPVTPAPILQLSAHGPSLSANNSNSTINSYSNRPPNSRPQIGTYDRPATDSYRTASERPTINVDERSNTVTSGRPVARVTSLQVADSISDDDIDLDQIAAIEEQVTKQGSNKRLLLPDHKADKNNTNLVKKFKVQSAQEENRDNEFPNDEDLIDDDMDYINKMEMAEFGDLNFKSYESKTGQSVSCSKANYPIKVRAEPFVYIKQIKEMDEIDRIGKVFRIKAQIMKLLSKLSVGKDGWSLKVTLIDGTGSLDADFTNDVLAKLVGISASDLTRMKKEIGRKAEVNERVMAALNAARHNLLILNCIIEITYLDTPKVTELIPFTEAHAKLLKDRLETTNL